MSASFKACEVKVENIWIDTHHDKDIREAWEKWKKEHPNAEILGITPYIRARPQPLIEGHYFKEYLFLFISYRE